MDGRSNQGQYKKEEEEIPLSPRELEILKLMCEGKTPKEIATELNIATKTASAHKESIYRKLHTHSLSQIFARVGKPLAIQVYEIDRDEQLKLIMDLLIKVDGKLDVIGLK